MENVSTISQVKMQRLTKNKGFTKTANFQSIPSFTPSFSII